MNTFLSVYLTLGFFIALIFAFDQTNKGRSRQEKVFTFIATVIGWFPCLVSVFIFPPKLKPANVRTNSQTDPIESVDVIDVEATVVSDKVLSVK